MNFLYQYFLFFLGLCNNKRIDMMLEQYQVTAYEKSDCDICKEQTQKLSSEIYHADKDLVVDKFLVMCGHAGTYSDACRAMVLENFDDIYE